VLRGLDLERHTPRFILVEVQDQDAEDAVCSVLGDRCRVLERVSPMDVLFEALPR
jgi:hypothetical protein